MTETMGKFKRLNTYNSRNFKVSLLLSLLSPPVQNNMSMNAK